MKPVVFDTDADRDLEAIGDYIARDNPDRAITFVAELRARAEVLGSSPLGYRRRDDVRPGLRIAVHGRYLIVFRVRKEFVEIVRIVHGARDLRRALRTKPG